MSGEPKRVTVYFEPQIHGALRLQAAKSDCSVSESINEAIKQSLAEDTAHLAAFDERAREKNFRFEDVVRRLR